MQSYDTLILSGSMLLGVTCLGACHEDLCADTSGDGNFNGSLGDQPTLMGQITGWTRGGGFTLTARSHPLIEQVTPDEFATAPIDALGNFSIVLPGRDAIAPYLTDVHRNPRDEYMGAGGNACLLTDPPDFREASLFLTVQPGSLVDGNTVSLFQGVKPSGPYTRVSFSYIDRDVAITGRSVINQASRSPIRTTFNFHYKIGWNSTIDNVEDGGDYYIGDGYTGRAPDGLKWTDMYWNPP